MLWIPCTLTSNVLVTVPILLLASHLYTPESSSLMPRITTECLSPRALMSSLLLSRSGLSSLYHLTSGLGLPLIVTSKLTSPPSVTVMGASNWSSEISGANSLSFTMRSARHVLLPGLEKIKEN